MVLSGTVNLRERRMVGSLLFPTSSENWEEVLCQYHSEIGLRWWQYNEIKLCKSYNVSFDCSGFIMQCII